LSKYSKHSRKNLDPLLARYIYTVIIMQNAIESIIYDIVKLRELSAKWGEPHWMATTKVSIYIHC